MKKLIDIVSGKSWWSIPFHFTLLSIIAFSYLAYFFNVELAEVTKHGHVITVPNLENLSIEEAESLLEENQLRFEISDTVFSEKHNMDAIVGQLPKAGNKVKENRRIYLTINTSQKPKIKITEQTLAKIKKADIRQVRIDIASLGLKIGRIDTVESNYKNYVLEAYRGKKIIEVGDYIFLGDKIRLEIGRGKNTSDTTSSN